MRIVIDSLIAVMLVAVLACVLMLNHQRRDGEASVAVVQNALKRLHDQAAYHTALASAERETLLVHVHEAWFGRDLPTNVLAEGERPWLDLAPPGDFGLHPPDPVISGSNQAGFWYNPTTGTFRARVMPGPSEAQTLALYNRVNGTALDTFEQMPDPARKPIAHQVGTTPARQYASMANRTWSEPEPPSQEQTERAFAPLIDPEQKSAFLKAVEQFLVHEDPQGQPADFLQDGANGETNGDVSGDATEPAGSDTPGAEAIVDEPGHRPTLKK